MELAVVRADRDACDQPPRGFNGGGSPNLSRQAYPDAYIAGMRATLVALAFVGSVTVANAIEPDFQQLLAAEAQATRACQKSVDMSGADAMRLALPAPQPTRLASYR